MRKLICILAAFVVMHTVSFAQDKTATKAAPKAKTTQVAPAKTATPTAPATKLKKDGTPDMRTKANKAAATTKPAAGPMKKDGTPDMRYKANKAATPSTTQKK